MNHLEQRYNAEIAKKLNEVPYENDLDFIRPFLKEIPISVLQIDPKAAISLYEGLTSYYVVGNVFNALVNTPPKYFHEDYLTAMDFLQVIMDMSKEWQKVAEPIKQKAIETVNNELALEQKKEKQNAKPAIYLPNR